MSTYEPMPDGTFSNPTTTGPIPASMAVHLKADRSLVVSLVGDWRGQADLPGIDQLERDLEAAGSLRAIDFDTTGLGKWNSALVARILHCADYAEAKGLEFHTEHLPPGLGELVKMARSATERQGAARKVPPSPSFLPKVGTTALSGLDEVRSILTFVGESVLAFARLARGRAQFRWADAFLVMEQCGPQALGIVALINFLVGLILAFVGSVQLSWFGASVYVADLVAIGTVREMACIMTGIVVCGRTGAAFAAQLGTMKVNQELDALATFGISTMEFLVLPRVIALVVMMPLLCLFADFICIAGGFLVSSLMLHVTPALYIHRTLEAITVTSFLLGIFKGTVFGVLVALTGCLRGLQCGANAAAVGQATTRAVVTGITAIVASDGLFAVLCNALDL